MLLNRTGGGMLLNRNGVEPVSSLPLYHTGREAPEPDARLGKKQAKGRRAGVASHLP